MLNKRYYTTEFVVFQKIPTKGASDVTFSTINGQNYLTVAKYYDGSAHSTKSVIYKWSSGKFNKFQEIPTEGALECTAFVLNNETFIAFTNYYNSNQKHAVQSTVFKWSGGHFVKLQSLQIYGAHGVNSVNINGHTFLAFANHYNGSKHNTDPFIYKWDGNKFVLLQSIPTPGAIAWHPFVIGGQTFLGALITMVKVKNTALSQLCTRPLKRSSSSTKRFQHTKPTFEHKGHTYLAVTNYYKQKHRNINSDL